MSWIATGVGVAGAVGGGLLASQGAKKQLAGMREAVEYQKQKDRETQSRFLPYQEFGKENINAFNKWNDPNLNPQSGYRDPGYDWRFSEGLKGLYSNAGVNGMLQSGDTLRAAQTYGQDMASQEYKNAFDRWLGEGKFRGDMVGMGQNAVAWQGNLGQAAATNVSNMAENTDYGAPDRVWADVASGVGGMAGNSLAKYINARPQNRVPGGSNIFSPQGPSVQPRNLDGSVMVY